MYRKHLYRGCREIASNVTPEESVNNATELDETMDIAGYLEADNSEPS